VTISATAAVWWVDLTQALLSSIATGKKERSQLVQSTQRGAERVRGVEIDIGDPPGVSPDSQILRAGALATILD
jgi:hypothetical protein